MTQLLAKVAFALFFVVVLAGCGAGGGSTDLASSSAVSSSQPDIAGSTGVKITGTTVATDPVAGFDLGNLPVPVVLPVSSKSPTASSPISFTSPGNALVSSAIPKTGSSTVVNSSGTYIASNSSGVQQLRSNLGSQIISVMSPGQSLAISNQTANGQSLPLPGAPPSVPEGSSMLAITLGAAILGLCVLGNKRRS